MKMKFIICILLMIIVFIYSVNITSSQLTIGYDDTTIPSVRLNKPSNISINNYYNISGGNGTMDYTNVALTNQSTTWTAGTNITLGIGGWFKGAFNWAISSLTPSSLATFNGTTLFINDTFFYNQSVSTSNFIPYNNSNQNVKLGDYNFSINNSVFFVDANKDVVGIGTRIPTQTLTIIGTLNVTNVSSSGIGLFQNSVGNVGIGTTKIIGTSALSVAGGDISVANNYYYKLLNTTALDDGTGFKRSTSNAFFLAYRTNSFIFQALDNQDIRFWNSTGQPYFSAKPSTQRVGIGTITPTHTLNVVGSANITGVIIAENDIQTLDELWVGTKAGIRTVLPTQELDVRGNGNFSGTVYVNNGTDLSVWAYNQTQSAYFYNMTQSAYFYNMSVNFGAYNATYAQWAYNQTQSAYFYNMSQTAYFYNQSLYADNFVKNGTYPWFRYLNVTGEIVTGNINISGAGGKVGIGTTAPGANMEIQGSTSAGISEVLRLSAGTDNSNPLGGPYITFRPINSDTSWIYGKLGMVQQSSNYAGDFVFYTNNNVNGSSVTEKMRITGVTGRVGIGTSSPTHILNVVGGANITTNLTVANNFFVNESKIGIGTSSPKAYLDINQTVTGYTTYMQISDNQDPGAGSNRMYIVNPKSDMYIGAYGSGAAGRLANSSVISTSLSNLNLASGVAGGNLSFWAGSGTFYNNVPNMFILNNGYVGIGTASPTHTLNVVGSGNITNCISVGGVTTACTGATGIGGAISARGAVGVLGTAIDSTAYGALGYAIFGVYGVQGTGDYAGYFDGQVYVSLNVSAQGFIDRSAWCDLKGEDALNALMKIKGMPDSSAINKSSMPPCSVVNVKTFDEKTNKTITEQGRDIGAYISFLTQVNQEQQIKINKLEDNDKKINDCIINSKDFEELKLCIK